MACNVNEIKQVEYDALPVLSFELEDIDLDTSFDKIELDVRLETGEKLAIKEAIIDDSENGQFHFEFAQGEVPKGVHTAELIFYDINTPTNTFRLPPDEPLRIVMRGRV